MAKVEGIGFLMTPEPKARRALDNHTVAENLDRAGRALPIVKSILGSVWTIFVAVVVGVWFVAGLWSDYKRNAETGSPFFRAYVESQTAVNKENALAIGQMNLSLQLALAEQKRQADDMKEIRSDINELRRAR